MNPLRLGILLGASLISAGTVLLINWVAGNEWLFADAATDFVRFFFTSIVIVVLLEWYEASRWRRADRAALHSLALEAHLAATGWSQPMNIGAFDLHASSVLAELEETHHKLEGHAISLDGSYESLTSSRTEGTDLKDAVFEQWAKLFSAKSTFNRYYLEGSRKRRLHALQHAADVDLPRLLERRHDPELAERASTFIEMVALVRVSVDHTDPIVYEHILVVRPEILSEFLQGQPDLSGFDSVALVSLAIEAVDWTRVSNDTALLFANRTLGAVRNELQWVVQALSRLAEIVRLLGDDIDESMAGAVGRERNVAKDWSDPFEGTHG
jgi:hypothetical protein